MHRWGGLRSMSLEMGSANGLHPAQYQIHDRLFIQVRISVQSSGSDSFSHLSMRHTTWFLRHGKRVHLVM